jgi:hypothetical protein
MRDPVHRLIDRLATRIAFEVRRNPPKRDETRAQYAAVAELRARYQWPDLAAAELRVFSQNGEDGVLAEIFCRLGITMGFFVEFGVEDGTECNTRFLADVLGWSGVYFEPDPDVFPPLDARYANRSDITTVNAFVRADTVNEQFARAEVPESFELLSIDIDGQDYWVWEAIDARPAVVVIECNSSLPAERRMVEPAGSYRPFDKTSYPGASLGALRSLGERKRYTLVYVEMAGVNAFFVRDDLAEAFPNAPQMRSPNYWLRGRGHTPAAGEYVDPG